MRKTYESFNEHCNKVISYKLKELVNFTNGKGHEKVVEENGKYILITSKAISTNMEEYRRTNAILTPLYKDDITMVMSDLPNGKALAKCFIVDENEKYTLNQRVCGLSVLNKSLLLPKFLYYMLNRNKQLLKFDNGVDQTNLRKDDILNISISVPPLEVQCEIVHILDNFTLLSAELSAELKARNKQYEYYRNKLLSFDKDINYIELKDLFNTKNGYTPSKNNKEYWENGTVSWYRMEDIRANGRILSDSIQHVNMKGIKGNLFPKNSIIISTSATIGEHALITEDFLCNQRFTCLMLKDEYKNKYDIKFLYYYCFLLGNWCLNNLNQGNFASVDMKLFNKFKFPIIDINKQKKIVYILEKLDKLCNDISEGLPAEIEARRKQYEYYKDKLLDFKVEE